MIVLKEKSFEEILKMVEGYKKILVVGCDGCAGIYQIGGEKQAEVMKMLLEMAMKLKHLEIEAKSMAVLRQCDRQIVATTIHPLIEDYEAILSMACGAGVQTLAEVFSNKTIIPANDTKFIGMQDRESGKFYELCSACGECILFETAGICPVTRCAKALLNGPCGGQVDGKCEVGNYTKDCSWVLIYKRLKENDRLDLFSTFRSPKDYRIMQSPQELDRHQIEEAKN